MTILIVDDVAIFRIMLKDIITKHVAAAPGEYHEIKLEEASDGKVAVKEYKRLKPDLVFLDVFMPGQNGKDTVKQIIEHDPNAWIIMCSGSAEKSVVRDCIRAGATDYVLKPLDPRRVALALERFRRGDASLVNLDEIYEEAPKAIAPAKKDKKEASAPAPGAADKEDMGDAFVIRGKSDEESEDGDV